MMTPRMLGRRWWIGRRVQYLSRPAIAAPLFFCRRQLSLRSATKALAGKASKLVSALHPLPLVKYHVKEELSSELPVARSKHGRFISPWPKTNKKISDVMSLLISNLSTKWNELPQEMNTLPAVAVNKEMMKCLEYPHITWIGHSTCYVQLNGKYFLTDPIWSARASMFQFVGPKRFRPPPIQLDELPIDYVLLSHDHYDHFDANTAREIGNRAKWIVPKGLKKSLKHLGVTNVVELTWWESHVISNDGYQKPKSKGEDSHEDSNGDFEIIFTPTQHWSCRTMFDRNSVLWGSFCVLSREKKFFFAGDTAYCPVFKQIGKIYGPFDLSILPIGAYKPRWFLKDHHVDPGEALQIHKDLCSKQSVAVHWGTFKLSEDRCVEPALELGRVRQERGVLPSEFATMAHGETVKFGDCPRCDYATEYPQFLAEHIEKGEY